MTQYNITTLEQLCDRIAKLSEGDDEARCSQLLKSIDPNALACNIRIVGDEYGPRIPGHLLQALADLQTSTMRTYAFLMRGKEDLRGLQKADLWSVIEVSNGSLKMKLSPLGVNLRVSAEMFKDLKPYQRMILFLLPPLLLAAYGVHSTEADLEVEKHRIDVQAATEAQRAKAEVTIQVERERTLQNAFDVVRSYAAANPTFKEALTIAEKNAQTGINGIVQNAFGAVQIDVGEKTFDAEEIREIQTPEALPSKRHSREGDFLVVQINSENPSSWKVQLKDVKTEEKLSAAFDPETLFLSLARAKEIFDYQRDEITLHVKLSVLEKADTIVSCSIDELKPI